MWGPFQSFKLAINALRPISIGDITGQSFKLAISALRRIWTGDIIGQFGMTIMDGGFVFLLLKRDRRSGREYIVLHAKTFGSFSDLFELDEFDRFIEAADDIGSGERNVASPPASRVLSFLGLVPSGQVIRRGGVSLYGGTFEASVRLMREQRTAYEYVVIAMEGPGRRVYYGFNLAQFHEFIESAKVLRKMSLATHSPMSDRRARAP
jgi:hypothetical protein